MYFLFLDVLAIFGLFYVQNTAHMCRILHICAEYWVLDKAEVSRSLLESVKARKLTYFGHVMRSSSESLEKQIMQGTTPGSQKRGRPKTMWMDNIFQWTGYTLDKILVYTEDRARWRQLVHGVAKPRSEDG